MPQKKSTPIEAPSRSSEKMNRKAWRAQRLITEINEWQTWAVNSMSNFDADLQTLLKLPDMPSEDIVNLANLRTELLALQKAVKPLEKLIHKSSGRRIRRTRRTSAAA